MAYQRITIVLRINIRIYRLHGCITYFITELAQNTAASACRASTTPPARKAKTTDCTQSLNKKAVLHKVVQYSEDSCEAACAKLKLPVDQDISEYLRIIMAKHRFSKFACTQNAKSMSNAKV